MNKREVVRLALDGKRPPYVPWSFGFTVEAYEKLVAHYGRRDLEDVFQNHLLDLGNGIGFFEEIGPDLLRDQFGVVWDRSDRQGHRQCRRRAAARADAARLPVSQPAGGAILRRHPGQDRALTATASASFRSAFRSTSAPGRCAGWGNLVMDFHDNPEFVHELFNTIADYNIAQVKGALRYDIDGVYFGDDWGMQRGLADGAGRSGASSSTRCCSGCMAFVRAQGKYVFIHSCGDVDELFDDLVGIGAQLLQPLPAGGHGRGRADAALSRPAGLPRRPLHAAHAALRHAWRTCAGRRSTCSTWGARAATSSPRPTPSRATCRWRTCWPLSRWCRNRLDMGRVSLAQTSAGAIPALGRSPDRQAERGDANHCTHAFGDAVEFTMSE